MIEGHYTVMLNETVEALNLKKGDTVVDCTVNRGGHSILAGSMIGSAGTLICFDLDEDALNEAKRNITNKLGANTPTLVMINDNFRNVVERLRDHKIEAIDALIADFGLSSQELDSSRRGFSFRFDEPLHMTFSNKIDEDTITAEYMLNNWIEETLADIIYYYSDEIYARRIAKAIVEHRKSQIIKTTLQLVEIIRSAVPVLYTKKRIHFATKTFQALRMAVNDELGSIKQLINSLPSILEPGSRAAVITFHSGEDRLVKNEVKNLSQHLKFVNKKVITPSKEELSENARSRSAKLRIIIKNE